LEVVEALGGQWEGGGEGGRGREDNSKVDVTVIL
jgi:hypothetical protein